MNQQIVSIGTCSPIEEFLSMSPLNLKSNLPPKQNAYMHVHQISFLFMKHIKQPILKSTLYACLAFVWYSPQQSITYYIPTYFLGPGNHFKIRYFILPVIVMSYTHIKCLNRTVLEDNVINVNHF